MESPDSALFEGIGSSVPRLYHRKELTNVHTKWVLVLIFRWFLSSSFYSRSSVPTDLDKLGKLKSYLDYIHLPGVSSLPFLVAVMPNLASYIQLGKLDHMGSFRYLPRLDQQV